MFPQLIAGPIVRYTDIAGEIVSRSVDIGLFASGIRRFIIGFAKKTVIANTMATAADSIWGQPYNTMAVAWIGSVAYTLQIYFDFSGYSDMAIGLGRMFGFRFRENFDFPYTSSSMSEFWRRWHISLSSWFRDYVYIPLGGSRRHLYRNLAVVFLLTGIWHGAAWNFVLWGVWHGFFVLAERFLRLREAVLPTGLAFKFFAHLYTLLVVHIGWVLFRADSLESGAKFIATMFGASPEGMPGFLPAWYLDNYTVFIFVLAVFFSSALPQILHAQVSQRFSSGTVRAAKQLALLDVFAFAIVRMVAGTYNPFIYFRF